MKYLLSGVMLIVSILIFSFTYPTPNSAMSIQVKDRVIDFAKAIEKRDITSLKELLHKDFRVVANQYPNAATTSILPKTVYLSLIEGKKIGGEKYEVIFDYVHIEDHSATVITKFEGKKSTMYLTLLLINMNDKWQIIEDMAIIK